MRGEVLPAGRTAYGPHRLPVSNDQQLVLRAGGGKASRARDSTAGTVVARPDERAHSHQFAPGVAWDTRHGYRRTHRIPLLLPRARRYSAAFRDGKRTEDDDLVLPRGRSRAGAAARFL